jgi:hypothetical protein
MVAWKCHLYMEAGFDKSWYILDLSKLRVAKVRDAYKKLFSTVKYNYDFSLVVGEYLYTLYNVLVNYSI